MRLWISGPRILGGLVRPGVSFRPNEIGPVIGWAVAIFAGALIVLKILSWLGIK